jgi:hypothetical protein
VGVAPQKGAVLDCQSVALAHQTQVLDQPNLHNMCAPSAQAPAMLPQQQAEGRISSSINLTTQRQYCACSKCCLAYQHGSCRLNYFICSMQRDAP